YRSRSRSRLIPPRPRFSLNRGVHGPDAETASTKELLSMEQTTKTVTTERNTELSTAPSVQILFKRTDLEKLLKLSGRTITKLSASGGLPAPIRIGLSYRWRAADIYHFIATQATAACATDTQGCQAAFPN